MSRMARMVQFLEDVGEERLVDGIVKVLDVASDAAIGVDSWAQRSTVLTTSATDWLIDCWYEAVVIRKHRRTPVGPKPHVPSRPRVLP